MSTKIEKLIMPYVRWTARVIGALLTVFMLFFFITGLIIGEGPGGLVLSDLELHHKIGFIGILLYLIGLTIAWKREGIGAIIAIGGCILFMAVEPDPWMKGWMPFFLIIALMYGYCWLRDKS